MNKITKGVSNMERIARECLESYKSKFGEPIYNYRPDFLKNPKTNRNLELDIYFPEQKIAFEINGGFHKLRMQKLRDKFKQEKCIEEGIKLYTVFNLGYLTMILQRDFGGKSLINNKQKKRVKKYKSKKTFRNGNVIQNLIKMEQNHEKQDKEYLSNIKRLFEKGRMPEKEYLDKKENVDKKYRL